MQEQYDLAFKIFKSEPDRALDILFNISNLDSNNPSIYNQIGYIYLQKDEFEKGKNFLLKSHYVKPNHISPIITLGVEFTNRKQKKAGKFWSELTLIIDPENPNKKRIQENIKLNLQ